MNSSAYLSALTSGGNGDIPHRGILIGRAWFLIAHRGRFWIATEFLVCRICVIFLVRLRRSCQGLMRSLTHITMTVGQITFCNKILPVWSASNGWFRVIVLLNKCVLKCTKFSNMWINHLYSESESWGICENIGFTLQFRISRDARCGKKASKEISLDTDSHSSCRPNRGQTNCWYLN